MLLAGAGIYRFLSHDLFNSGENMKFLYLFFVVIFCSGQAMGKGYAADTSVSESSKSPSISVDKNQKNMVIQMGEYSNQIPMNLPSGMALEGRPRFFGGGDFALIVNSASEAGVGTSIIYAINSKAKLLWSMDLESFNPSIPLIEKDFIYMAALGKVFKIEKKTGNIIWSHEGLYENKKYLLNGGERIIRKNDLVIFSDKVKVKDQSGKLVEVE
jgi:hypothetical protein